MRLIDRYLLREYLIPLAYCLITFSMVFVLCDLFENLSKIIESRPTLALMVRYYLYQMVPTLDYILPASLMMATLYTLWHLSRNNEIVAMMASGISLGRILGTFLIVGFLCSLLLFGIKETVAPKAYSWAKAFSRNNFKTSSQKPFLDVAYYNTKARRQWMIGSIEPSGVYRMTDVKVTQEREDETRSQELIAKEAKWLDGRWWFFNAVERKYNPMGNPILREMDTPVPGSELGVEVAWLSEKPSDFLSGVVPWKVLTTKEMKRFLRTHPRLSDGERLQKESDIHARLALPWSCLIVTLFGIPAGMRSRRQSVILGVFLAIILLLAFYFFMQAGVILGKRGIVAPWIGAWMANVVFLVASVAMIRRTR